MLSRGSQKVNKNRLMLPPSLSMPGDQRPTSWKRDHTYHVVALFSRTSGAPQTLGENTSLPFSSTNIKGITTLVLVLSLPLSWYSTTLLAASTTTVIVLSQPVTSVWPWPVQEGLPLHTLLPSKVPGEIDITDLLLRRKALCAPAAPQSYCI